MFAAMIFWAKELDNNAAVHDFAVRPTSMAPGKLLDSAAFQEQLQNHKWTNILFNVKSLPG
jgi:hypothetical protein